MRDLVYHVAVSLDGFIAGRNGDASMFPDGDHAEAYLAQLKDYDTVIMGRRTYEYGYSFGLEPGQRAYPHMRHVVMSTSLRLPGDAVEVWNGDAADRVQALKRDTGTPIYLCGGGTLAGALHQNGLIDRMVLKICPLTLGEGVPLLAGAMDATRWRLSGQVTYASGVIEAHYLAA